MVEEGKGLGCGRERRGQGGLPRVNGEDGGVVPPSSSVVPNYCHKYNDFPKILFSNTCSFFFRSSRFFHVS